MNRFIGFSLTMIESYRRTILSLSLALLMLGMSAAFALDAGESESLPEEQSPRDNHSPLHEPGAPLGSVYTNLTVTQGYDHSCMIQANHSLICWGAGGSGRLGHGSSTSSAAPVYANLPANETPVEIGAGWWHTCGLMESGKIYCWGGGGFGQMGNGQTQDNNYEMKQVSLPFGRTGKTIAVGEHHVCTIADNDEVYCWGNNEQGAVGASGYQDAEATPVHVDLPGTVYAISIGAGNEHTCVAVNTGRAYCWGENWNGQLGHGGSEWNSYTPVMVNIPGNRDAVSIAAGGWHSCAVLDNGKVMCWGSDWWGQLGDGGSSEDEFNPVYVSMGSNTARAIVTGWETSCMILDSGETQCWGKNNKGEVGTGDSGVNEYSTPATVAGSHDFVAISMIDEGACAINSDAEVWCWGNNWLGAAGNGQTNTEEYSPVELDYSNNHAKMNDRDPDDDGILTIFDPSPYGCIAGTWINISTGDCAATDQGYYTDQPQMYYQIPCANGTYQPASGQTSCLLAPAGYYVDYEAAVEATPCPAGEYQPTEGQTSCLETIVGHYTTGGDANPIPCAPGSYQPASGQSECILADPGYHVDSSGSSTQSLCAPGGYSAGNGTADCTLAELGSFVAGTGATDSDACGVGTYADVEGLVACKDADAGHYVDTEGASAPTPCPVGQYQTTTGQTECMDTEAGHYTSDEGSVNQRECDRGSFQSSTGASSCDAAEVGHFVDEMAASVQTPCTAGSYQNEPSSTYCKYASEGHHVPDAGSSSQTRCPVGTFSDTTGLVECHQASPGYTVIVEASTSQDACEIGTYQSDFGQTHCDDAEMGHYVPSEGASAQTPCPMGTYQSRTGQSSCVDSEPGYFAGQEGMTNPDFCTAGTYQPNSGQSACLEAEMGHYVELSGKTEQTPCKQGNYQPNSGQTSCLEADAGHIVPESGASAQTPCEPGTYQDRTGEITCRLAAKNNYVDEAGSDSQKKCATGYSQPERGQSECLKDAAESSLPIIPIAGAVVVAAAVGFFMMNRGKSGGPPKGGASGGNMRRGPPQKGAKRRKKRPE